MPSTPHDAYLESKILTADPLELVRLLYSHASDAVCRARAHLDAGRIAERSQEISRALAILWELSASLDHAQGGTLSRSLAELYDYMQRRLLEANMRQEPEPLAEVESLLATLREGWERIRLDEQDCDLPIPGAPPAYGLYGSLPPLAPDSTVECSRQWSF